MSITSSRLRMAAGDPFACVVREYLFVIVVGSSSLLVPLEGRSGQLCVKGVSLGGSSNTLSISTQDKKGLGPADKAGRQDFRPKKIVVSAAPCSSSSRDAAVAAAIVSPFQLLGHERGRSTGWMLRSLNRRIQSESKLQARGARNWVAGNLHRIGQAGNAENAVFCLDR